MPRRESSAWVNSGANLKRPGDWVCSCSCRNFKWRSTCYGCGKSAEASAAPATAGQVAPQQSGWDLALKGWRANRSGSPSQPPQPEPRARKGRQPAPLVHPEHVMQCSPQSLSPVSMSPLGSPVMSPTLMSPTQSPVQFVPVPCPQHTLLMQRHIIEQQQQQIEHLQKLQLQQQLMQQEGGQQQQQDSVHSSFSSTSTYVGSPLPTDTRSKSPFDRPLVKIVKRDDSEKKEETPAELQRRVQMMLQGSYEDDTDSDSDEEEGEGPGPQVGFAGTYKSDRPPTMLDEEEEEERREVFEEEECLDGTAGPPVLMEEFPAMTAHVADGGAEQENNEDEDEDDDLSFDFNAERMMSGRGRLQTASPVLDAPSVSFSFNDEEVISAGRRTHEFTADSTNGASPLLSAVDALSSGSPHQSFAPSPTGSFSLSISAIPVF